MFVSSILHPRPNPGNSGIVPPDLRGDSVVPPWIRKDLGVEATQPTVKGHEGWRADFRK